MELCVGTGVEPAERLLVRIRGQSKIVVGVCYRPSDNKEEVHEAFFRRPKEASSSQALVLMKDFNNPDICCRDNVTGLKQSRGFLVYTDIKSLTQVIKEMMRGNILLDLIFTNKEALFRDEKAGSSLGCGY